MRAVRRLAGFICALCTFCALCSFLPAQAIVQPRIYEWRMRLMHTLPDEARQQAIACAQRLGLTGTPQQIEAAVVNIPYTNDRAPLELLVGIEVLLAQDQDLMERENKLHENKYAIGACQKYLRRLNHYRPGKAIKHPRPSRDGYEILEDEELNTPAWNARLRLPSYNETTDLATISRYRSEVEQLQRELEQEQRQLRQDLKAPDPSHEMRRYVLNLCDSIDPLTCQPYPGKRPQIQIFPPSPLEAQPINRFRYGSSKTTNVIE